MDIKTSQWALVIGLGAILFMVAPTAKTNAHFFRATTKDNRPPNLFMLTSSLVIAWIFAKSIANAANLGMAFGMVGGLAYACYYLSFFVAGVVIYRMRTVGGITSMHQYLSHQYGPRAVQLFSVLIAFRLFNEVWSNTMVIGSYFGPWGSAPYFAAVTIFTGLTLAYVLKGGLKTSLFTDTIQMMLFAVLLTVILGVILPKSQGNLGKFLQSGSWQMSQGLNLLFVALIQILSYPFHDPVMTDRGFIASPKTTLYSFSIATVVGFLCILLFSFVGIYANFQDLKGDAAVAVSQSLGTAMMLVMNLIMITSAGSTLDSTFSAFSKLVVVDLGKMGEKSIQYGRMAMVALAIVGTVPVFLGPEILSATTISGTMVIGLGPVFLLWRQKAPPLSFHLSVGTGLLVGLLFAFKCYPSNWTFTDGPYADLLAVNVGGTLLCFILFFVGKWITQSTTTPSCAT